MIEHKFVFKAKVKVIDSFSRYLEQCLTIWGKVVKRFDQALREKGNNNIVLSDEVKERVGWHHGNGGIYSSPMCCVKLESAYHPWSPTNKTTDMHCILDKIPENINDHYL